MAFDPALSKPEDKIRRAVGDVSDTAPIMDEATYVAAYALADSDLKRATIQAAEWLISAVGSDPTKVAVEGAVTVEWSATERANRLAGWRNLANALRAELGLPVIGGGVSNTLVMGRFTRGADTVDEFGG